jgi:8-oxo-dGTP pyrophosphatase MutT (NUDIX family)
MVVRDGAGSLEVLMLRRSLRSDFVRGAYVFPGGAVDEGDTAPEMLEFVRGRDEEQANALLELDSDGLGYWVASFRECFEEAGVLVATGPDGVPLTFEDPEVERRFIEHRRALNAGDRSFLEICRAESLTLPADAVYYVGHWITPVGPPRRYDTRFFTTLAPPGQIAVHDDVETIDHMWAAPIDALAQHEEGRIDLVPPTIWSLRLLDRYGSTAELFSYASALGAVPTMEQRVTVDEHGQRQLVMPVDPADAGRRPTPEG